MDKIEVKNRENDINAIVFLKDEKNFPIEDIYITKDSEIKKISFFMFINSFLKEDIFDLDIFLVKKNNSKLETRKIETIHINEGKLRFNEDYKNLEMSCDHKNDGITLTKTYVINNSYLIELEEGEYELTIFIIRNISGIKTRKIITIAPFFVSKKSE